MSFFLLRNVGTIRPPHIKDTLCKDMCISILKSSVVLTGGDDEAVLEPVDGGRRGRADDAADLVVQVDHGVLLHRSVVPGDAD